jgi:hypothetical protein
LTARRDADATHSAILLTTPERRLSDDVGGHYVDRAGRCYTLYDQTLEFRDDRSSDNAVVGTFRATAERCGSKLQLRGTLRACFVADINTTCK